MKAATVKTYEAPMVSPLIAQVVAGAIAVQVAPPGAAVTTYLVIADPPSLVGGVHEIVAEPPPGTAVTFVGFPGAMGWLGVTEVDAVDALLVVLMLRAVTENEYAVPEVRPLTVHVVAGAATVQVAPPGAAVTV